MAAATLLGALTALFDADSVLTADTAATGGLWVGGIPEDRVALPAVALLHHDEVPDWTLDSTTVQEEGSFSFVVYAQTLAVAEALAADLKAVYDPSSRPRAANQPRNAFVKLSITNGVTAFIRRKGYQVQLVEYRAADSTWVYEVTMPYHAYVQRTV